MPPDSNPELVPVTVIGDGNCLFWSISLVLFGDEDHHCELRVRSSVELACNIHAYMKQGTLDNMAEYSCNKSVEYILQVSISDDAFGTDMERSLKAEIILDDKKNNISVIGGQQLLQKAINSIYLEAQNPVAKRRLHNQIFFPDGQIYYPKNLDGMINILWTHTSDTNLQGWKPNQFVSCFPRILLSSKEIQPHRDTEPMFAEDEEQPEAKTQTGDDSI